MKVMIIRKIMKIKIYKASRTFLKVNKIYKYLTKVVKTLNLTFKLMLLILKIITNKNKKLIKKIKKNKVRYKFNIPLNLKMYNKENQFLILNMKKNLH